MWENVCKNRKQQIWKFGWIAMHLYARTQKDKRTHTKHITHRLTRKMPSKGLRGTENTHTQTWRSPAGVCLSLDYVGKMPKQQVKIEMVELHAHRNPHTHTRIIWCSLLTDAYASSKQIANGKSSLIAKMYSEDKPPTARLFACACVWRPCVCVSACVRACHVSTRIPSFQYDTRASTPCKPAACKNGDTHTRNALYKHNTQAGPLASTSKISGNK